MKSLLNRALSSRLDSARQAFEPLVANRGGSDAFAACGETVQALEAAFETADLHAAAPLLDEIPLALARIADLPLARRGDTLAQVNDAFERVHAGLAHYADPEARIERADIALIDEMRALRGAPLLSAHAALAPDLDTAVTVCAPLIPVPAVLCALRNLRPRFEQALLAWLRAASPGVALEPLIELVDEAAALCAPAPPALLWAAAGALCELMGQGQDTPPVAARRLVTRLDGALRRLTEGGGDALRAPADGSLLRSLLYRVETYPGGGRRAAALCAELQLGARFAPERVIASAARAMASAGLREAADELAVDRSAAGRGDEWARLTAVADALALAGDGLARRRVLLYAAAARGGDRRSAARRLTELATALEQGRTDLSERRTTPPLATSALMHGFSVLEVQAAGQAFALPSAGVVTVQTLDAAPASPGESPVLSYGGRDYPLRPLAELLAGRTASPSIPPTGEAVLIDLDGRRAALVVDRVRPRPPLPAQPPEGLLATVPWLAGITPRTTEPPLLHLNLAVLFARHELPGAPRTD